MTDPAPPVPPNLLKPGDRSSAKELLGDRYFVKALLGKQPGRRTLLADDLQTGASVVVKLVLFGPEFSWEELKLFKREAETLKSLNHPAIPKYLDFFEVDTALGKGFALVQTHIKAKSLQAWVAGGRRFGERELQPMARALLGILQYLHSHAPMVIHRDIKPSNILLSEPSAGDPAKLYLVDFGAVQTVKQDGTLTVVGTYGYMPPEQFGGRAQPASDLYSLGATLVFLATGQHPAKLTQDNLQLEFDGLIAFSKPFNQWLRQMTSADLGRRLKTAQAAIAQLSPSPSARHQSVRHQSATAKRIPAKLAASGEDATAPLPIQPSTRADFQLQATPAELSIRCLQFRLREPFRMRTSLYSVLAARHESLLSLVYLGCLLLGLLISAHSGTLHFNVLCLFTLCSVAGVHCPVFWTSSGHSPAQTVNAVLHRQPDGSFALSLESIFSEDTRENTPVIQKKTHFCQVPLARIQHRVRSAPFNSSVSFVPADGIPLGSIEQRFRGEKGDRMKLHMLSRLRIVGTRQELAWLKAYLHQWQTRPGDSFGVKGEPHKP